MNSQEWLPHTLNLPFVEQLQEQYRSNPDALSEEWRRYFAGIEEDRKQDPEANGRSDGAAEIPALLQPSFRPRSLFHPAPKPGASVANFQDRVDQLIRAFRARGHMAAQIDPLGRTRPAPPELNAGFYGFSEPDLQRHVSCETVVSGGMATLGEVIERLRNTYCRFIGVEFAHIEDVRIRRWLQARMEPVENRLTLTRAEQWRILNRLTHAVSFEEFIRKKFLGAKSFSLEGSESLVPLLDLAIEKAAEQGISEIVFGMAHRGRLNVLANTVGKPERQIFREFMDADFQRYIGRGDVKYHLGHSNDVETSSGAAIHLSLCFNPSHLELVNPVVLGRVRAKQDRARDALGERGLAILIHGDAALAGEGVVQETLNMSQLPGYTVGGALHIVVNNQIGFTTGPEQGRSTTYATDVFKMLQVPILHVNGEHPEAVAQCVRLALDFRAEYRRDVVIDMYGYRRLGHNESDEPSFTQPKLYQVISRLKGVREAYLEHLLEHGGVTRAEADEMTAEHRKHLEAEFSAAKQSSYRPPVEQPNGLWLGYKGGPDAEAPEPDTAVPAQRLSELLEAQARVPTGFRPHQKLKKFLEQRREMAAGRARIDWSSAEALALASVATSDHSVRLSGQDSERGTFSQRHAVLHEHETGETYVPLQHLTPEQARVDIVNSPLSEMGVMGFEYGYSLDRPEGLVMWEAQFGDFWNMAQVYVDQFIATAEAKWNRLSGLVLLLPHGLEGQGPEHSSARVERFLALAAEDNLQVVYPTTPAQYFHVLRRQVIRPWRKPLVVLTPKSLLRDPRVTSTLEDFAEGRFQRIITSGSAGLKTRRVLLCTGKVFYDLEQYRIEKKQEDIAIVRIEQLYPIARAAMEAALGPYRDDTPIFWVQEEPENMGAWRHMALTFGQPLLGRFPFHVVSRPISATPATGSHASHEREQAQLIERAFNGK